MKKRTFLVIFLLLSSLILSQTTNINPIKCLPESQVVQIYSGLKQSDYLKMRLSKTEEALNSASLVISEQKISLEKKDAIVNHQDEIIKLNEVSFNKEKESLEIEINRLEESSKIQQKIYKKDSRKNFWKGIKTGGVIGAILTVSGFLLIK